ncbi:MAG: hypothetical protein ACC645_20805 [Pirellulales bacterium]
MTVNYIAAGKPILIEAGTPSYSNPDMGVHYASGAGHALEVRWPAATMTIEADAPLEIKQRLAPDSTLTGKQDNQLSYGPADAFIRGVECVHVPCDRVGRGQNPAKRGPFRHRSVVFRGRDPHVSGPIGSRTD